MSRFRSLDYLQLISDYPLAVVLDQAGDPWTWAEGRSTAVAVRGVIPGMPAEAMEWGDPKAWKGAIRATFAGPRRRASRVYTRGRLLDWAGDPWTPPADPCPYCAGTGQRLGTSTSFTRPGAIRDGVLVDLNLLARVLVVFEAGAVLLDAHKRKPDDPIRMHSVCGDTRALIARIRGSTDDMTTFEQVAAQLPGSLSLDGHQSLSRRNEKLPQSPQEPSQVQTHPSTEKPGTGLTRAPRARREYKTVAKDTCIRCGRTSMGRLCSECGAK